MQYFSLYKPLNVFSHRELRLCILKIKMDDAKCKGSDSSSEAWFKTAVPINCFFNR